MWNLIKDYVKWLKYRFRKGLWWNTKEKARQEVYHESKGEKSYMIEISSGKAIYENKQDMEKQIRGIEAYHEKPVEFVPHPFPPQKIDYTKAVNEYLAGQSAPERNMGKDI